jgi:hypothetical protein
MRLFRPARLSGLAGFFFFLHLDSALYTKRQEVNTPMIQITKYDEENDSVTWLNDIEEFETPEHLEDYLRRYAPEGSYRVENEVEIFATREAIRAAQEGFLKECEEEEEFWRALGL